MNAHLRPATPENEEEILALMIQVVGATVNEGDKADTIQNVKNNLEIWRTHPNNCVHLVMERKPRIVGVVLVKEFWNLCSLFVAPDMQRNGIGKRLVLAALEACKGRSPRNEVLLNSAPTAVRFYTRLGFQLRESNQELPPGYQPMRLQFTESEA